MIIMTEFTEPGGGKLYLNIVNLISIMETPSDQPDKKYTVLSIATPSEIVQFVVEGAPADVSKKLQGEFEAMFRRNSMMAGVPMGKYSLG